ncbi:hypothetical protein HQ545_03560 [Candidatus Woesearchaeota archaeon]|nr:hypothetical protein [Candidatus Woesearchaeota archaeon]
MSRARAVMKEEQKDFLNVMHDFESIRRLIAKFREKAPESTITKEQKKYGFVDLRSRKLSKKAEKQLPKFHEHLKEIMHTRAHIHHTGIDLEKSVKIYSGKFNMSHHRLGQMINNIRAGQLDLLPELTKNFMESSQSFEEYIKMEMYYHLSSRINVSVLDSAIRGKKIIWNALNNLISDWSRGVTSTHINQLHNQINNIQKQTSSLHYEFNELSIRFKNINAKLQQVFNVLDALDINKSAKQGFFSKLFRKKPPTPVLSEKDKRILMSLDTMLKKIYENDVHQVQPIQKKIQEQLNYLTKEEKAVLKNILALFNKEKETITSLHPSVETAIRKVA